MPLAAIHDRDVESGTQDDLPTTVAPMPNNFAAALAMENARPRPQAGRPAPRELPLLHDANADPDEVGETVLIREERAAVPKLYESGVLDRGSTAPIQAAAVARPIEDRDNGTSGPRQLYARPSPPPPREAAPLAAAMPAPLPRELSAGKKLAIGVFVFLLTAGALTAGVNWLWINGLPHH